MAQSNNPRFADSLKKSLNLKSSAPLDPLDDLFPVFPVWDASKLEADFARGERRWMSQQTQAGGGAQFAFVRLENPVASGLLCMVDFMSWVVSASNTVLISTQFSVGVGATAGQDTRPLDGRGYASLGNASGMDCRKGTRAAVLGIGFPYSSVTVGPGNTFPATNAPGIIVLPPGWSVEIEQQQANLLLICGFLYRVRAAEPNELLP